MTPRTDIPVILLAFANDADCPLRGLAQEHDALQEILKLARKEGECEVVALTAATPDTVAKSGASIIHLMKAFELTELTEEEIWLLKQFVVLPVEQYPVAKLAELLDAKPLALNKTFNSLAGKGWFPYTLKQEIRRKK